MTTETMKTEVQVFLALWIGAGALVAAGLMTYGAFELARLMMS